MIIWLASYPRSGNTFTRAILKHYFDLKSLSVYGDRADIGADQRMRELVGHTDGDFSSFDLAAMRRSPQLFIIKTHDTPSSYMEAEDRVVYVLRNGLNSCLSFMKYLHKFADLKQVTLRDVVSGQVMFGLWGNHILRWKQAQFQDIHFFKFEDIVVDHDAFADELARILVQPRSHERFPEFSTFQAVNSDFFSTGQVAIDYAAVSAEDQAIFDLFNGVATRLVGYCHSVPTHEETAAYALFCERLEQARTLESEKAWLVDQLRNITSERDFLKGRLETIDSIAAN